jgi:LPXTG-site transpeptidase (sortase) family protein
LKGYLGELLLIVFFIALSLIPPFYLLQRQEQRQDQPASDTIQILGSETENGKQGKPRYLRIPKIDVNAYVEEVALTPEGEMDVPKNTFNIGWFNLGPRPGEVGSSVMVGHLDGENGKAGVFFDLYKLKEGDKMYVEDDKGVTLMFTVRGSRIYDPGYAEEVFSSNNGARLNLITCDGVWDGVKKSFSKRLVVFADILN